jgi:hypothetical protein
MRVRPFFTQQPEYVNFAAPFDPIGSVIELPCKFAKRPDLECEL